jgi:hypothetical protein
MKGEKLERGEKEKIGVEKESRVIKGQVSYC